MPQIHLPTSSGYTPPTPTGGISWLPYADADDLKCLKQAITIIDTRINGHTPCNTAFRALPAGRTFRQLWSDNSIWISMDPSISGNLYGAALGNHVTLTKYALAMGRWTAVATLVHELAHVGGAPGSPSKAAEEVLQHCLLKDLYDPTIIGSLTRQQKTMYA